MSLQFKGNPVTLAGRRLKVGNRGADFRVVAADLKEIRLSDFESKIKVITTFLSLDTSVCDLQVKEFNRKTAGFASDIVVLGISKDLPFAQKRFCHDNDINNITILSDYKYSSFGINYGLLIKELNLLARSILILDKNDTLRYAQFVEELANAPNYEDALENLKEVINNPAAVGQEGPLLRCKPCETGIGSLPNERIGQLIAESEGWDLVEGKKIVKEFKFKDFIEAKYFLDLISIIAEEQGHHPTMTIIYNRLKITLTTHAAGGLTENDFIMAKIIGQMAG